MPPETDGDTRHVKELVCECLAMMEGGGDTALDTFCAEHPEHAEAVRQRIGILQDSGLILESGAVEDRDREEGEFPERLGEFRLLRKLGAGGMGVVYLAEQESVGRRVALKLVRPELLYFDKARTRFQREIESAGRLQHPGIVSIHAVGEESNIPFFAMEYIKGCSLADILIALRDQAIGDLSGRDIARVLGHSDMSTAAGAATFGGSWVETCFRLMRQACAAIEHAHENGVLHRDLKPSNMMVTPEGRLIILDFGVASLEGSGKLTQTGSRLGSLDYMSPEQIRGAAESVGPHSDIYSLGVTLYELLTKRSPYSGTSEEMTRTSILEGRPRSVRSLNRHVAWDAETVCLTAMEQDPRRRYASAADFARDLDNLLALRPIEARRPGAWLRVRRWAQRSPARAAALVLLVLGPLAFAWTENRAAAEVRRERDVSESSLDLAFAALDEMGTQLAETDLRHVPQASQLRRRVLETTLKYSRLLLAKRRSDPRAWIQMARAHNLVAEIHMQLGSYEESRRHTNLAIETYEETTATFPAGTVDWSNIAIQEDRLAALDIQLGHYSEAESTLLRVAAKIERILPTHADKTTLQHILALVLNNLGSVRRFTQRPEDAIANGERVVSLREQVVRAAPTATYRNQLASSYRALIVLLGANRHQHADAIGVKALAIYAELRRDDPGNATYRTGLALLHNSLGNMHRHQRNWQAVDTEHAAALALRRGLARDFPSVPMYRSEVGGSLGNLAGNALVRRRYEDARKLAEEALQHQKQALAVVPNHARFRQSKLNHLSKLAQALCGLRRHSESTALAKGMAAASLDPGYSHYVAGMTFAWCRSICAADKVLTKSDRARQCEVYARRAIEYLNASLDHGFGRFDPALDALAAFRGRADFQKLVVRNREQASAVGRQRR
jgi:serine/threonine protein kinase